jgi:hypothetical protein
MLSIRKAFFSSAKNVRSQMHVHLEAPDLLDEFQSVKQRSYAAVEYVRGVSLNA